MKKFNVKYLYYMIVKLLIMSLLVFLFSFLDKIAKPVDNTLVLIVFLLFIVFFAFVVIYSILYWNRTTYEITDEGIILCKGVLLKRKTFLKYERMHAIDRKQGLIQKLFDIQSLSIDSGSTTKAFLPEIVLYGNKQEIEDIFRYINSKIELNSKDIAKNDTIDNKEVSNNEILNDFEKHEPLYDFSIKKKIVFCSIYVFFLAFLVIITFLFIELVNIVSSKFLISSNDFLFFIAIFSASVLLIELFSIVILSLSFYNFEISKTDKAINIKYGLFVSVCNTINYDKIKALKVDYGIVKRFFGLATIKIEVVGFGGDSQGSYNNNVVIPLCKKEEVNMYIKSLLPDYVLEEKVEYKAKKKTLRFFVFLRMLISSFLIGISYAIVMTLIEEYYFITSFCFLISYLLIELLIIFVSIIEKQNTGLSIGKDKIYIHNGGILKKTTVIDFKNIIGIECIDTYSRFKAQTVSFIIHYFNAVFKNTEKVKMLDISVKDELEKVLKY